MTHARTTLTLLSRLGRMIGGGSRKGSKGNAVRALAHNAAAAPATVSGEPPTHYHWELVFLGRWSAAMTREPGDLPPLESRAGALGGVS
jgi:hypothetical protein